MINSDIRYQRFMQESVEDVGVEKQLDGMIDDMLA
jgi:hypothetical protein